MTEQKQEQMTGLCVHGNFASQCLECKKINQEQKIGLDLNLLSKFREQSLNKICPELKENPDLKLTYLGEERKLKEIIDNNPYVYPEFRWSNDDIMFENLNPNSAKEKTLFKHNGEIDPEITVDYLIGHIQSRIKKEVFNNISLIEFINKSPIETTGENCGAESQIETISGKGQIRLYKLEDNNFKDASKEERNYELRARLYHELGHMIWRTFLHPLKELTRELRGTGHREIAQNDRERWFGILMNDETIYNYIQEQFYHKGSHYAEEDRIEEGWAGIFSQVAINPAFLDKFPKLKTLMSKFFKP